MIREIPVKDIIMFDKRGLIVVTDDNKKYAIVVDAENEGSATPTYTLKLKPIN